LARRNERRSHRRVKAALFCWCSNDQFQAGGTILNVSPAGAFIRLPVLFRVGEKVTLDVLVPPEHSGYRVKGVVIWSTEGVWRGCGVRFLEPAPELIEHVRSSQRKTR